MDAIVGHDRILSFLRWTVLKERPAHAYLFTGREGVGKKRVAVMFAAMLNCPDPHADVYGTCSVCRRITAQNHPDFLVTSPEKGMIRIEKVRNVQSFFRYAPVEGKQRVVLIDDAHRMNTSAQNALLKTLEEPPSGRILLLISDKPALLLPTVRSRCRRMRFGPIPVADMAAILEKEQGIPSERARLLAAMSGGSFSKALSMDSKGFSTLREEMISFISEPGARGLAGILELSAAMSADRMKALRALEIGCTWIRDVLSAMTGAGSLPIMHEDMLDRILIAAQHHSAEDMLAIYGELAKASDLIEAEINVNRNLVMDVLLLKIARILTGPTMGVAVAAA